MIKCIPLRVTKPDVKILKTVYLSTMVVLIPRFVKTLNPQGFW